MYGLYDRSRPEFMIPIVRVVTIRCVQALVFHQQLPQHQKALAVKRLQSIPAKNLNVDIANRSVASLSYHRWK